MAADTPDFQTPGYKILHLIGRGANATVYLALQESLNRHVALKIMQKFDRPAQAVRFFNEGQIVASMNHPNIITIYDIGSVGNRQYIAMEYLENGSLRERIKEGVSAQEALEIVRGIASALDFVHQMDIVHRDIKPENILFHKNGIPKITDFGVAKALDRDMNLTMDGTALGSPYYLSPEQAEGKDLDGRSDIYSLGVILFEMLAQHKPYLGESQIEVIFAHLNKPVPTLPKKHHHYQALVEKMMAKDASQRFASASELLEYLDALRRPDNTAPRKNGLKSAQYNPTSGAMPIVSALRKHPVMASMGGLAAVGIIAAVLTSGPSSQETEALTAKIEDSATTSALPEPEPEISTNLSVADTSSVTRETSSVEIAEEKPAPPLPETVSEPETDPDPYAESISVIETGNEEPDPIEEPLDTPLENTQESGSEPLAAEDTQEVSENAPAEEDNLEALLEKGNKALKRYRLTRPRNDNAYYYYNKALKLDPGNKAARQGLNRIADKYALLADKALKKGDEEKARAYLKRGLRIRPGNKALEAKVAYLDELEAARRAPPPPPPPPKPAPKPEPEPVNTSLEFLESLE